MYSVCVINDADGVLAQRRITGFQVCGYASLDAEHGQRNGRRRSAVHSNGIGRMINADVVKRICGAQSRVVVVCIAGSPGGSTIITSVFQTIMNTAVFDMPLYTALAAPKFHSQWLPDQIFLEEGRFPVEVVNELENREHKIVEIPSLGRVDAILANGDGTYQISGDPRGDNTASGYK